MEREKWLARRNTPKNAWKKLGKVIWPAKWGTKNWGHNRLMRQADTRRR